MRASLEHFEYFWLPVRIKNPYAFTRRFATGVDYSGRLDDMRMKMVSMRHGLRLTCCFCMWFAISIDAWALDVSQSIHSYQLDRWYSDEGLPHNTVHNLSVSDEGYVWASTWEGLARYNGLHFKNFDSSNIPGLGNDGFRAVLASKDGSVWGGTAREGLVRFKDGIWSQLGLKQGLSTLNMYSLEPTVDGIWAGTQDAGAIHVANGGKVKVLRVADGLYSEWVQCIKVDSDGSVWIGTARGLNLYARGVIEPSPPGLPEGAPIYAVLRDRVGRLWAGSETGLYYFENGAFQRFTDAKVELKSVSSLLQDRDGGLWIGTQSQGLFRYSDRGLEQLSSTDGLTNNRVTALVEDHEGGIWIATNGGLNRIFSATFSAITRASGLRDEFVRSIHEGKQRIWIGTSQGVFQFAERRVSQPDFLAPVSKSSIMAVHEARDGKLWAGTYDSGIANYDGKQWNWYGRAEGLPSNQVRVLFEASDGAMWIGTSQGTQRLDQGSKRDYTRKNGLPTDFTLSIGQLRNGDMLIGTSRGFARISGEQINQFTREQGFPATDVFAFLEDLSGTLWIGTYEGLVRFQDGKFSIYTRENGLPDNPVFAINEDGSGNLLLSTNTGLVRVARNALMDGVKIKDVSVFGRADGMAGTQINGSSQPSTWRTRDGELWLPTARGVSVLNLARTADRPQGQVTTVIESISVDGDEQGTNNPVVQIEAGKRRLRIDYAGLSFTHAARTVYRYRLLGFEPTWSTPGRDTSANFTNLGPGRYRFEVQADFGNFKLAPTAHVDFIVKSHLYQTKWFWMLATILIASMMYLVHRLRLSAARRRERVLERQVEQRTEELSNRNLALEHADRDKSALLNTIQVQAEAFARQAREDALTGLANRRHFDLLLAQEFIRRPEGQEHWLAIADLDHFKAINDRYSHQAGDDVLRVVSAVIEQCMHGHGMAARYGGEEFALSFTSLLRSDAEAVCEKIRKEIAECKFEKYPDLQLTVSIGINQLGIASNHEKLLADADLRLYEAKHRGRNQIA